MNITVGAGRLDRLIAAKAAIQAACVKALGPRLRGDERSTDGIVAEATQS
jgi:hypothetical protein